MRKTYFKITDEETHMVSEYEKIFCLTSGWRNANWSNIIIPPSDWWELIGVVLSSVDTNVKKGKCSCIFKGTSHDINYVHSVVQPWPLLISKTFITPNRNSATIKQ